MKRSILAWLAVFFAWSILDGLGHGLALRQLYAECPEVFRPREELKIGLIYLGVAVASGAFVGVFVRLISNKSVKSGVYYGLIYAVGIGASMACGGYSVHPIPMELAVSWFVLTLIEGTLGGWLVGQLTRNCSDARRPSGTESV